MAHTYSNLFELPTTGLRFFTVYGPWGRPDMALFVFTKAILAGEKIPVFNYGKHTRDFTYIDDIVEGVVRTLDKTAKPNPDYDATQPDPGTSSSPWRVYNIGGGKPSPLMDYIAELEKALGKRADKQFLPMQDGDVPDTTAAPDLLERLTGYKPQTPISVGVPAFVGWFRQRYNL